MGNYLGKAIATWIQGGELLKRIHAGWGVYNLQGIVYPASGANLVSLPKESRHAVTLDFLGIHEIE